MRIGTVVFFARYQQLFTSLMFVGQVMVVGLFIRHFVSA